jgi:hypothetical protein
MGWNPCLGGYRTLIPVFSALCAQLNLLNLPKNSLLTPPPPPPKLLGMPLQVSVIVVSDYEQNLLHSFWEDRVLCAADCTVQNYTMWSSCTPVLCLVRTVTTMLHTVTGPYTPRGAQSLSVQLSLVKLTTFSNWNKCRYLT